MLSATKQPDLIFSLEGDIYKAQRRPGYAQLIINQDYSGISVLDVWNQQISSTVTFPQAFAEAQVIDAWCLRANGKSVVLFNQEQRIAVYFSLDLGESAYSLNIPTAVNDFQDLRYLWQGDTLLLSGGKTSRIFSLEWLDNQPVFVQKGNLQTHIAQPGWVRALDQLPTYHCNVLRVQCDTGEMLYHNVTDKPVVGVVNWKAPSQLSMPAPKEVPGVAYAAGHLFVLHEYEIHALDSQGAVQAIYPVANGFHYSCFDALQPDQEHPAALVAIASKLSNERQNLVHVYFLAA
jgi:hypothetical protein